MSAEKHKAEQHKQIAREFLRASVQHDGAVVEALLTEDATYWVQGDPALFAPAGDRDRAEMCAYFHTPSMFKDGLKQTFGAFTGEGDRVAVEMQVEGVAPNGKVYRNTYHYLLTFRDGKISGVKEYLDTYPAVTFFGG
jgi:ketosteroid isomerase-like protein